MSEQPYQTRRAFFPENARLVPGSREHTIRTAHILRDRMEPEDRAYWGAGKLSYPQALDLLCWFHRNTVFFDVPPPTEGQRVTVLEAEIARLKRKAGEA